uniref:Glutathione S-transferase n=1 Tax=Solanum tuberosum TaxID=4113 RepID=M1DXU5_SOLTU
MGKEENASRKGKKKSGEELSTQKSSAYLYKPGIFASLSNVTLFIFSVTLIQLKKKPSAMPMYPILSLSKNFLPLMQFLKASSNNTRLSNTGSSVAFMASSPWEIAKQRNDGNHCSIN